MFIDNELYKNILGSMPIPTVDILFINLEGEILLGRRNNQPLKGIYYIPGGRVNKGERSLVAAKRKAKEELNIDIDVSRLQFVGVYDDIFDNSAFEGISTHCISVLYTYHLNSEEYDSLSIGDTQHTDLRFFSPLDSSLHDMVKMRIVDIEKRGY